MTSETHDLKLRLLTVLEPDAERRERVRAHCRAAIAAGPARLVSRRRTIFAVVSGLTYGLSAAYLLAIVADLVHVYLRR
jgi:hypothetical protein